VVGQRKILTFHRHLPRPLWLTLELGTDILTARQKKQLVAASKNT
jgi:hypothetical protein